MRVDPNIPEGTTEKIGSGEACPSSVLRAEQEACSFISQRSPGRPILSLSDGWGPALVCKGGLLRRVEWEGEKTNLDPHPVGP